MPKLKTHKGASKRFKRTARGKFKRSKAYARHMLSAKTRKQKRNLRHGTTVASVDVRQIRALLPYL